MGQQALHLLQRISIAVLLQIGVVGVVVRANELVAAEHGVAGDGDGNDLMLRQGGGREQQAERQKQGQETFH